MMAKSTTTRSKSGKSPAKDKSSLARKTVPFITRHRPMKFEDLVGMEKQAEALSTSIADGEIPNAYVLLGSTGCGKTTVGRIIARTVMCKTGTACGECDSCLRSASMDLAGHPDYSEINCGVTGKVDDIRGIIQLADQRPMIGRMRVILLDEIHRLTPQAVEALLKPLEEPSEQTLWILATSEANSVKQTIKNRCEFIPIKPVSADVLGKYIAGLAKDYMDVPDKERVEMATEIANVCGGFIRDSLTLMNSAIKMYNSHRDGIDLKEFLDDVRDKLLSNADVDVAAAQELVLATLLGNPKCIVNVLADHSDFVSLSRNMTTFTQYLLDCVFDARGANIFHPPVFREGNKKFVQTLNKRDRLTDARRVKALTIMLDTVTQLHSKVMTFSCPERPLISSHLLKALSEIKPITATPKRE